MNFMSSVRMVEHYSIITPPMRQQQELEYIPVGLERPQHFPTIRGFLLKWLCVWLGRLCKRCSRDNSSLGGEVEERIIEF